MAIHEVIIRTRLGVASADDIQRLEQWLAQSPDNRRAHERIMSGESISGLLAHSEKVASATDYAALAGRITRQDTKRRSRRIALWLSGATACVAVVVAVFLLRSGGSQTQTVSADGSGAGVMLVLDSGEGIAISEVSAATIGQIANVTANEEGQLVYTDGGDAAPSGMHKIVTGTGLDYSFFLNDGTRVWLDARTTIEYPSRFDGGSRVVRLTGEAFFEVTADAARPFIVECDGVSVEVLGTAFNVNAYPDGVSICTTVESGRVVVSVTGDPARKVVLEPGMQAVWNRDDGRLESRRVNIDDVTIWRSGYYVFEEEDIESVLRVLSRWHDVEFVYEECTGKTYTFSGKIGKMQELYTVLDILNLAEGPRFEKTGERTIRVIK